jgi:hypothetical protein
MPLDLQTLTAKTEVVKRLGWSCDLEFEAELGLAELADTVGALHRAVSTSDAIVRGPDGNPFGSLFNSFVIDEERMRKLYGG